MRSKDGLVTEGRSLMEVTMRNDQLSSYSVKPGTVNLEGRTALVLDQPYRLLADFLGTLSGKTLPGLGNLG